MKKTILTQSWIGRCVSTLVVALALSDTSSAQDCSEDEIERCKETKKAARKDKVSEVAEQDATGFIFYRINKWSGDRVCDPHPEDGSQAVFTQQVSKKERDQHLKTKGRSHADKDTKSNPLGNLIRQTTQTDKAHHHQFNPSDEHDPDPHQPQSHHS